ncbi:MAG TPA: hypothetical protein DCX07_04145 [Phycisphaerales bacterium]|nr:hypothetical protein [Phycisphaerales bacterium]
MPLRSFTQAELLVTERKRFERPLLLMIWLGILLFSFRDPAGNLFFLVIATLAIGVNYLASQRGHEVYVHRVFVNTGVLMAAAALIVELFRNTETLEALGHFMILIQLCKLFERKTNRDYVQMLLLSLLLVLGATLQTGALGYAILLVVYLLVSCYTAMIFTLKRGLDAVATERLSNERAPLEARRLAWNVGRHWPARALRRRVVLVMSGALATGVLVFLAAPHGSLTAEEIGHQDSKAITGFPDAIHLGQARQVYQSDRVVMKVRLGADEPGRALPPTAYYLRLRAYPFYENSQWPSGPSLGFYGAQTPWTPPPPPDALLEGTLLQEVTTVSWLTPGGFAAYAPVKVESDDAKIRISPQLDITLMPHAHTATMIRYRVWSWLGPLSPAQREYLAGLRKDFGLGSPRTGAYVHPRVSELARKWCDDLLQKREQGGESRDQLDLAIASRLAGRLKSSFRYTLDLSKADYSRDGVEDFLFHMKRGHCEYFASAMAVMCNALDVRARLVSGFHIAPTGLSGDLLLVRERDAHAWVEVFTPTTDWVLFDPTPSASEPASSWWQSVSDFWEGLAFSWREWVLGFDSFARRNLWQAIGKRLADAWRAVVAACAALGSALWNLLVNGRLDTPVIWLVTVLALATVGIEAFLVFRHVFGWRRRRRLAQNRYAVPLSHLKFIQRLFDALERQGVPLRVEQTPLAAARAAARTLNLPAATLEEIVAFYYRLRWGRHRAEEEEIRRVDRQVDGILRRLAEQTAPVCA